MMTSSNEKRMASTAEWDELRFLREWIVSLPLQDLLHAMTLRYDQNDEEWELLKEMVRIQPPPPIPIHPRAIPKENYRVASVQGLTDGRCEEFRRQKLRFVQPRWFQLFSRRSTVTLPHGKVGNQGINKRNIRNRTPHSPSTDFSRNSNDNYRLSSSTLHDVFYKSFASPWGEPLTIGTTLDQQRADHILLQHTRISSYQSACNDKHHYPDNYTITCSISNIAPALTAVCSTSTTLTSSRDLLRLFQVTSRGLFLSQPYIKRQSNDGPYHFAPWFHPDQEWFSLTKYLTSRFEVAIRDSFLQVQNNNCTDINTLHCKLSIARTKKKIRQKYTKMNTSKSSSTIMSTTLLEKAITTWPLPTINMCFLKAMKQTLSQHILMYNAGRNMLLRDHLLFQIFHRNSYKSYRKSSSELSSSRTSRLVLLESLRSSPLIELGEQRYQFRLYFLSQLYNTLIQTLESQLLIHQDVLCKGNNYVNENDKLAKRKSKKKKKNYLQNHPHTTQKAKNTTASIVDIAINGKVSLSSSSDDEERLLRCQFWSSSSKNRQQQKSSPRSRDHTQSTIVALTIIESIIEHVFLLSDTAETSNNNNINCVTDLRDCLHSNGNLLRIEELLCEKSAMNESYSPPKGIQCSPTEFTNDIRTGVLLEATLPIFLNHNLDTAGIDAAREEDFYLPSYLDPIYEPQDMPTKDWNSNSSKSNAIMKGVSLDLSGSFDGWKSLLKPSVVGKDHSQHHPKLFDDFFRQNDDRPPIASSTAASVASSVSEPDVEDLSPHPPLNFMNNDEIERIDFAYNPTKEDDTNDASWIPNHCVLNVNNEKEEKSDRVATFNGGNKIPSEYIEQGEHIAEPTKNLCVVENSKVDGSSTDEALRTSSTHPLSVTAQQQQPIQLSLADLGKLRVSPKTVPLRKSWSRGNLAQSMVTAPTVVPSDKDDYGQNDLSMAVVPLPGKGMTLSKSKTEQVSTPPRTKLIHHLGDCAVSESGMESDRNLEWHNTNINHERIACHENSNKNDCSVICEQNHQRVVHQLEDENMLREERNAYRDLALTLGAEVSKLRNLLAAEQCSHHNFYRASTSITAVAAPFNHVVVSPEYMPRFFWNDQSRIAMSDSGHTRGGDYLSDTGQTRGDYESIVSEDGIDMHQHQHLQEQQQMHNPHCIAELNVSVEFTTSAGAIIHQQSDNTIGTPTSTNMMWKLVANVPVTHATLQSRLSSDIDIFMQMVSFHLTETEDKRKSAIARFERMVRKLWPRAQVKMYGSHVSNLCLPSSDLDFVICLPAVHKAFLPSKPGVLEGRNAIKESCQKLLARTLKGESWIDPRSIKVIERTAVPIIKVTTKDILAKVLQLDISFDGPGHYGLEAITLVKGILDEFPKVRPLTLVLKQFLLDRGLLTAYTGGLSSYCLFLMVTRFLQEDHCWSDCGSLLLGFLDFYGNSFNPAATGISVRRRSYFSRQDNPISVPADQRSWSLEQQAHLTPSSNALSPSLPSNKTAKDIIGSSSDDVMHFSGLSNKVPRASSINRSSSNTHRVPAEIPTTQVPCSIYRRPCTFDPLFVEDPLNPHNNVGRNAFRIFQIKRAFADAHRALLASLDWPSETGGEGCSSFSILQCLLLWN